MDSAIKAAPGIHQSSPSFMSYFPSGQFYFLPSLILNTIKSYLMLKKQFKPQELIGRLQQQSLLQLQDHLIGLLPGSLREKSRQLFAFTCQVEDLVMRNCLDVTKEKHMQTMTAEGRDAGTMQIKAQKWCQISRPYLNKFPHRFVAALVAGQRGNTGIIATQTTSAASLSVSTDSRYGTVQLRNPKGHIVPSFFQHPTSMATSPCSSFVWSN